MDVTEAEDIKKRCISARSLRTRKISTEESVEKSISQKGNA